MGGGGGEQEKHRKQVEHAARSLLQNRAKGGRYDCTVLRYVWGVRLAIIADMVLGVADGGEMDLVKPEFIGKECV